MPQYIAITFSDTTKNGRGYPRPYGNGEIRLRKALRLISGAAAHPVVRILVESLQFLEIFFSICALIGSVVLPGLIALIPLFGAHVLLVSFCIFVPSFVSLFVGQIGPIITVVVIWHFQSLLKHYFAPKVFYYERKFEEQKNFRIDHLIKELWLLFYGKNILKFDPLLTKF